MPANQWALAALRPLLGPQGQDAQCSQASGEPSSATSRDIDSASAPIVLALRIRISRHVARNTLKASRDDAGGFTATALAN